MKKTILLLLVFSVVLPVFVFAQKTYTPLVPIPGVSTESEVDLRTYLSSVYKLLISLTVILSVVVITIEGLKHMASESPFGKSEAKKRMGQALGGMLLAVTSWLILNTINPDLVSFNFLNGPSGGSESTPATPTQQKFKLTRASLRIVLEWPSLDPNKLGEIQRNTFEGRTALEDCRTSRDQQIATANQVGAQPDTFTKNCTEEVIAQSSFEHSSLNECIASREQGVTQNVLLRIIDNCISVN